MSAFHVIEHALRTYYVDSTEPNAIARELLDAYRAEVLAEPIEVSGHSAHDRLYEAINRTEYTDREAVALIADAYAEHKAEVLGAAEGDEEKASATAPTATPHVFIEDAQLRALHNAMTATRGEWRTGDVRRVLRAAGFKGLGRNTASQYLRALVDRGLATAHGPDDGRFYTLSTKGGTTA